MIMCCGCGGGSSTQPTNVVDCYEWNHTMYLKNDEYYSEGAGSHGTGCGHSNCEYYTNPGLSCSSTDNGAINSLDMGCTAYTNIDWCEHFDVIGYFVANDMCCECGGGQ